MHIDLDELPENMIAKALRLDEYLYIMGNVQAVDISTDRAFQRTYDHFYRVRKNEIWRGAYFQYFEKNKRRTDLTFGEIITNLFEETGTVEASFSSKLLATVEPDMPIWDQYVLKNLGFKLRLGEKRAQLKSAIELYQQIVQWYAAFLLTEDAKKWIAAFDRMLPHYCAIADVKKIDFILWSIH